MFHELIERICGFPEMRTDPRIDFERFKKLLIKAMRMRQNKQQVGLLFKIIDTNKQKRIRAYDLSRVSRTVNYKPLTIKEAQDVVNKCSASSQYITKEDFHYVMKKDGELKRKKTERTIDANGPHEDIEATRMEPTY